MNKTYLVIFIALVITVTFLFFKADVTKKVTEKFHPNSPKSAKNSNIPENLTKFNPFETPTINGVRSRADKLSENMEYYFKEYSQEKPIRSKPIIEKSSLPFVAWQMKFEGSILHKPVIRNGNLYVATNGYQVHSLKTRTGSVLFSSPIASQPIGANLFVHEDKLIVAQRNGAVDAIDLKTGKQFWHHRSAVDEKGNPLDISISGISINEKSFFVSKHWGNVYIGSLKTGATTETPGVTYESRIQLPSVFYNNTMIFTNVAGELHTFDIEGSKKEWMHIFEKGYLLSLVEDDGSLYGINNLKELIRFDLGTKSIKWKKSLLDVGYQSLIIDNDVIYIGAGNLYAINKKDGNIIWQKEKESGEGFKRPITLNDKTIYCTETNGLIYSINKEDGKIIKKWNIKEPIWSGINYSKGLIFVPTIKKRLYTIKTY
ncbi:MAG: hypothetical protein COA79_06425 [Planctomycetota bacterium]|nr:MAG: hypothetical protein COA79_06425 [Planctomycetota bacterium]